MGDRKIFLDCSEEARHPLLSEYVEIIAGDMEVLHPKNFGGCLAYFNKEGLKDAYTLDYFWITEKKEEVENKERSSDESRLRYLAQQQLYSIANHVKAVGGVGTGYKLLRNYNNLDEFTEMLIKEGLEEDKNLTKQLAIHILEEKIINLNEITPNNFFYKLSKDSPFFQLSRQWIETIKKAIDLSETYSTNVDLNTNFYTRILAVEGIKKMVA